MGFKPSTIVKICLVSFVSRPFIPLPAFSCESNHLPVSVEPNLLSFGTSSNESKLYFPVRRPKRLSRVSKVMVEIKEKKWDKEPEASGDQMVVPNPKCV